MIIFLCRRLHAHRKQIDVDVFEACHFATLLLSGLPTQFSHSICVVDSLMIRCYIWCNHKHFIYLMTIEFNNEWFLCSSHLHVEDSLRDYLYSQFRMLFSHAINLVFFLFFHCQWKEEGTDIRHSFAVSNWGDWNSNWTSKCMFCVVLTTSTDINDTHARDPKLITWPTHSDSSSVAEMIVDESENSAGYLVFKFMWGNSGFSFYFMDYT